MSTPHRPDVILIVLDTLRADRLSCYSYRRHTSPHIDAFAQDGVLFERAVSPAQWTIPSHGSLFTGEYPTAHGTIQLYQRHAKDQITMAEVLQAEGYLTVGFCNNVMLGIVENDLDRGFDEFYNYGGTLPQRPAIGDARPRMPGRIVQRLSRSLYRLTVPMQDVFARNNDLLRILFHPRVIPLWQRHIRTKGNTAQSVRDVVGYLKTFQRRDRERPVFAFVNLMETHLPYGPPPRFIHRFVPYYHQDDDARRFMQRYNLEYYRWLVPLLEPMGELQNRVINDMYDAEVAYEDHLLRHLFEYLDEPYVRDNTLVVVTSDHGEGLGNHHLVGHSLFAYDDLLHVPLIVRYPRLYPPGARVATRVSTRRIFHAVLEAVGVDVVRNLAGNVKMAPVDVPGLSLTRALTGTDPEQGAVFAEAYPQETLITLLQNNDPHVLDAFRCRALRRAAYQGDYKLIAVDDRPDELFDLARDPGELHNLADRQSATLVGLQGAVEDFCGHVEARRLGGAGADRLRVDLDDEVTNRLRGLGYLG